MARGLPHNPATSSGITLNEAETGRDLRIHSLDGPSRDRLLDLGFREDLKIRKLSGGRNLVCSLCGTRLAISRELAAQVVVGPAL